MTTIIIIIIFILVIMIILIKIIIIIMIKIISHFVWLFERFFLSWKLPLLNVIILFTRSTFFSSSIGKLTMKEHSCLPVVPARFIPNKMKRQTILLTLLICWAFRWVVVFCLNATRTDLCLVRVLLSRAHPLGPPLSIEKHMKVQTLGLYASLWTACKSFVCL